MNKPTEPSQEDCCNSGCNPCIFDVYQKQLKLYQISLGSGNNIALVDNGISQMHYTEFIVTDIKQIGNSLKEVFFKRKVTENSTKVLWDPGSHFLVKYFSDRTCTRAYTPIKLRMEVDLDYDFRIIVKKYEGGLVSNYLFHVKIGDQTWWRGPYCSYAINKSYNKIIMIAQGTGIAPFVSIIDSILNDEDNLTSITLLYCCQNLESVLFRNELYDYKSYWNFVYKVFVSNSFENDVLKYNEPIVKSRLRFEELQDIKLFENAQFLLCGSSQFMSEYKLYLLSLNILTENIITF